MLHARALTSLTLFVSLGSLAHAQKKPESDPLEAERGLLAGPKEEDVRDGAQRCRKANTKAAMELLLEVLNRPQPHFRDIVWEELPAFTDPEARARVEEEMKQAHDEDMRAWCAQLLGAFGDQAFGKSLDAALNHGKVLPLLRAACQALGQLRYEGAVKKLDALTTHKDVIVRANALEALARIKPDASQKQFLKGLADADGGVRAALLGALPTIYPDLAEQQSLAMLNDGDWRVCAQAIDNLTKQNAADQVTETILKLTHHPRPALQQRAMTALAKITGQKWTTAVQWEGWWQAKKSGTAPSRSRAGETAAPPPSFFGHYVLSDHVAFLIDRSSGMDKSLKDDMRTRREAANEELENALAKLPDGILFNVYCYANEIAALSEKPLKLDDRQRRAVKAFVEGAPTGGRKDVWKALSTVLQNPTLDTIFLLSSGEPEVGLYVHHNRVAAHVKDLNRFYKVTINAVVYDEGGFLFQIENVTSVTGGRCVLKQ